MKLYQYLDTVVGLIDGLVLLIGLYDADGCSDVGTFGATTHGMVFIYPNVSRVCSRTPYDFSR